MCDSKKKYSFFTFLFNTKFQDLKAFNYYYHFAYPCPSTPIFERLDESKSISDVFDEDQLNALAKLYFNLSSENRAFFIVEKTENSFEHFKLCDKISVEKKEDNFDDANLDVIYFCFSDPCPNTGYSAWPLRLFLLMLTHLW